MRLRPAYALAIVFYTAMSGNTAASPTIGPQNGISIDCKNHDKKRFLETNKDVETYAEYVGAQYTITYPEPGKVHIKVDEKENHGFTLTDLTLMPSVLKDINNRRLLLDEYAKTIDCPMNLSRHILTFIKLLVLQRASHIERALKNDDPSNEYPEIRKENFDQTFPKGLTPFAREPKPFL